MQESVASPLGAWESFYVIVGSSAAALTGLQFVVMALVAESRQQASSGTISAFGTPTIVHFCAALLLQFQICTWVLLVVVLFGSSRQRPELGL